MRAPDALRADLRAPDALRAASLRAPASPAERPPFRPANSPAVTDRHRGPFPSAGGGRPGMIFFPRPAPPRPAALAFRAIKSIAKATAVAVFTVAVYLISVGLAPAATGPAAPLPRLLAEAAAPSKDQARATLVAVRIIDGDTVEIAGETIRLADIDAPELKGKCDAERRLARAAAARLEVLLSSGRWVLARQGVRHKSKAAGPRRDRYGRTLGIAFILAADGRTMVSAGQILVAEGLARVWDGRRHPWCGTQP